MDREERQALKKSRALARANTWAKANRARKNAARRLSWRVKRGEVVRPTVCERCKQTPEFGTVGVHNQAAEFVGWWCRGCAAELTMEGGAT